MLQPHQIHLVIFGLLSLYMPIAILLFAYKQHHPAIKFREPNLTIVSSTFSFIYTSSSLYIATFPNDVPCVWGVLSMIVSLNIAIWLYLFAQLILIARFQLTQKLAAATVHGHKMDIPSYSFYRLLLKRKSKLCINALIYAIASIPALITVQKNPNMMGEIFLVCSYNHGYLFTLLLYSFGCILQLYVFFYCSRNLKHIVDNFGLQSSFRKTNRSLLLLIIVFFAFFTLDFVWEEIRKYNFRLIASSSAQHVMIYYNVIQPLRNAFTNFEENYPSSNKQSLFEEYLTTDDGFAKFSSFCRLEFNLENIMSWKAVMDYKNKECNAQLVYENYIARNSPFETNIPDSLRQNYLRMFHHSKSQATKSASVNTTIKPENEKPFGQDVFDPFKEAIVKLMAQDTLPRFTKHDLGETWVLFLTKSIQFRKMTQLVQSRSDKSDHLVFSSIR